MSKHRLVLSLLVTTFAPLGCADDDVDGDVAAGWRATSKVLGEQQLMWDAEAEDGRLEVSIGCADGGSASAEGTFDGSDQYSVTMAFDGCRADGVVISGSLSIYTEIVVTEDSAEVTSTMEGTLRWSGAVEGECSIDMELAVAADASGEAAVSIEGELCGYDAHAVVTASAKD